MRVGLLLSGADPGVGGGFTFEREVFWQIVALANQTPHRFVLLDPPPGFRDRSALGAVELGAAAPRPVWRAARWARGVRMRRIAGASGVDLIWNLWPTHPVPDVPFITIVWDLQHRLQPLFPEVSARGEWEARERHYARCLRRAAAVIAGTGAGRREIATFYQVPSRRIHVLPHPTPDFALSAGPTPPGALQRFRLPPGFLLYPAQIWPHKNHANLLLALAILKQRGAPLPLVLVGSDKGNATRIRALATRLGIDDWVHWLGFVTSAELVALYRSAIGLAYVSLFGPENLPPLEAFALGCPVLAARVSGAQEQLGEAALLVDATHPPLLADELLRLVTDTALRARLVARGRERAERWTTRHFVLGGFDILDGLAPAIRCWREEEAP